MVFRDYKVLLKRLALSFIFFTFTRIVFYFYNFNYFSSFNWAETLFAFVYGFRFDLSIVLIANLIFILSSLLPIRNYPYRNFLKIIFVISNTIFLGVNIVDWEFFQFLGKKMTFDIFDIQGDINNQLPQLILNYWFICLCIILSSFALWQLYPRRQKNIFHEPKLKMIKVVAIGFVIFIMTGIGIRGGLQLRSISPKEAFIHSQYELGNLTLNAAYSMVRSIGVKGASLEKYFKTDQDAKNFILENQTFESNMSPLSKKPNIIVIIIESLSQEYIENGYTPFFSKLAQESLYFSKNMANGRRSIEALPSIFTGFPSIIGKPLSQSQYQSNKFIGLPKILKENHYQTGFFHGGKKGTMDFDAYCASIGFEKYYALEDYPDQSKFDGHWGIYDHHFFDFFIDTISKYKEPFFTGFFSLSSHQPYSIPAEYWNKFPKGTLEIHESIGYIDFALEKFFERAKEQSWYNNTLFVITADHTSKLESNEFNNSVGQYRVPLLFFHPRMDLRQFQRERLTQQVDIMPSILDFVGIKPDKKLLFGNSVFSNTTGRVLNNLSGNYFYYKDDFMLRFNGDNATLSKLDENMTGFKQIESDETYQLMLQELKAYIQYTNNGLRNNNIYDI